MVPFHQLLCDCGMRKRKKINSKMCKLNGEGRCVKPGSRTVLLQSKTGRIEERKGVGQENN